MDTVLADSDGLLKIVTWIGEIENYCLTQSNAVEEKRKRRKV